LLTNSERNYIIIVEASGFMSNNLIITISRERGAGGTKIAKSVAKILEIPYYSKEAFLIKGEDGHRKLMNSGEIKKIIAQNSPCVTLGRCADYVMADKNLHYFSVFIKAPHKTRKVNLKNEYDLDSYSVDRVFEKEDDMKKHFEKYTGMKWGSSRSYDLVLNTGKMRRDDAIKTICEIALGLMNKKVEID